MNNKVLIISGVFPPEQVTSASMNYDLAVELAKELEVVVLRPFPTRPQGTIYKSTKLDDKSFNQILLDSYTHPQSQILGRFRESIDFGWEAIKYIKKHHEEICFIYNNGWQLFSVFMVSKVAKKYGIPYMVAIQDIYPESLFTGHKYPSFLNNFIKGILGPMDKYYQKNAYRIRTISDEMASYLAQTRNIPMDKYIVVNNWQNDEDFLPIKNAKNNEKLVFAYVGSINIHSNTDLIIKAFHRANLIDAELHIYGGGNRMEQCKSLVKKLGLTNVKFDLVSRDLVPVVQGYADILVLALPKGNGELCLPSKITSYMLSGKPILASVDMDSATHRYLKEAECGIVVEPDNEAFLAEAFRKMGSMTKDRLYEMGKNGKLFADNNLSKKVNLKKVVDTIKDCIKNKI